MENVNQEELSRWVVKQTAYLDPPAGWRPDSAPALMRFHARIETDRPRARSWRWLAWAAVAALVSAVILLPAGRGVAQQLWQFLTVRQEAFIRVNPWPEGVPSPAVKVIGLPIPPVPARDVSEAGSRVHYVPRLPYQVLSGTPRLSTTFSLSAGTVVKVADLELALRKAGVTDQAVPPQWDGAQLALHTSAIVIAEWPDIIFAQSLPLTLTAPPGFNFAAFSTLILRVVGVGPDEAQRFAQRMGTVPPWLAPIGVDIRERATIEEIDLNSGAATLLRETEEDGAVKRATLVWSVPDRVYSLSGKLSRELAIATANAVQ
ncbi:MAG TPA: hypothetical protein VGZ73_09060 [Bryobacteraceae bacterium]|jgi:hypothetical protein|nr:hypothetical protein [Bryobacteraceae bacterium]